METIWCETEVKVLVCDIFEMMENDEYKLSGIGE